VKARMNKLDHEHNIIKKYIEEYYILLVEKFEDEITSRSTLIKDVQEKNTKDVDFYEVCRDNFCEEIEKKTKAELIQEADKLAGSFTMNIDPP
jgi:DNA-binding protein